MASKPLECTPAQAAALFRPTDSMGVPLGPGQPPALMHALGERDDWVDFTVFAAHLIDLFALFARPGVHLRSGFFGPAERALRAAGHDVVFVPGDFRRFAQIAREFDPRVVATAAAPPDEHGRLSLSLHAGATVDELHRAGRDPDRLLVVETSTAYPRTAGLPPDHSHAVELSEVDVWIHCEPDVSAPRALDPPEPTTVHEAIARHAADFVPDGATLQTGIGGVPSAVVSLLANGDGGDYGVHSEMFTDGLMDLHESGKVSNRKGVFDGISVATFAMGSHALYDWLDAGQAVGFAPADVVNDPAVISRNRDLISLNGALCVDLFGQLVADDRGQGQFSGIGGHEDFLAGAGRVASGRSLICLPATAGHTDEAGRARSRIVAQLPPGALVTSPRHQVDVVVTEHGAAELAGRSVEERADALAEIAAPECRDELRAAAKELRRRGVL